MNSRTSSHLAVTLCAGVLSGYAQSAWVPDAGQFKLTPGFSFSTFDEFWAGETRVSPLEDNDESLDQYTGYLSIEYGILPALAADATLGYTATSETDTFGSDSDDGLADTSIGLRYRLLDERQATASWVPTASVRVGVVIPGTYDENLPFSAGDGAYGFESSLLLGKSFGETGFGAYGEVGYRIRESPVPDDLFGAVGIFQQIGPVTLTFGYRHVEGLDGLDIGGPGFDPGQGAPHGFPALKEINQLITGGVALTDNGGRNYQFVVAKSVDGRNTGDKLVFGFNVTIPLGGR